jgi:Fur family ferric uptake transcriptional regulator
VTRQRTLIWQALTAEPDRHLSAGEVVARVREEMPRVNPSTVYRTLDLLVADGLVLRTDLGADRVFYEPAHDHRHHHLVCRTCGAVAHVHDEAIAGARARLEAASGFALGDEEITFFGVCPACRAGGAGS